MEVQDFGRDLVVESANIAFNTLDLVEEAKTLMKLIIIPIKMTELTGRKLFRRNSMK
jgi:hypothetical protein